jgi:uncharacterized protein
MIDSTTYEVVSSRMPTAFDGFRILQISDLHHQRFGTDQSRLLGHARMARPDLVAITGDLTYRGTWSSWYVLELARELADLAPVHFVTGNHDCTSPDLPGMLALLKGVGVQVLSGRSIVITRGKESIAVAGIDDPRIFREKKKSRAQAIIRWKANLATLRRSIPRRVYTILLSHRPEFAQFYAELGFDLVLAGHAHGGQIRLPLVGAMYAPNQGLLPRYTSGMYSVGATRMVVSRGLGKSHIPVRLFNRPELVVVRLTR